MKKSILLLSGIFAIVMIVFTACQPENVTQNGNDVLATPQLPNEAADYESVEYPDHFASRFSFANRNNPNVTNDGATLGRVLFYDTRLSVNNSVSCASCHHQDKAFSDGLKGSTGFGGKVTPRNSLTISNASLTNNLFWDSRVNLLPELILEPIQNHVEMGMEDVDLLVAKLASTEYYPALFEKAYGSSEVTAERVSDAMSQFLGSMKSISAKYDEATAAQNDYAAFSDLEKLGMEVFFGDRGQCVGCHAGSNFSNVNSYYDNNSLRGATNIGLDLVDSDQGIENGRFRIPSLRNVALSAPYMHDGRYETLEEVVEFYDSGVKSNPNLDPRFVMDDGSPIRLNLTEIEKQALVAFMHTLTDENYITDPKFSDPFRK